MMKKILVLASLALATSVFAADNKNMITVDVGDVVRNEGNFNTHLNTQSYTNQDEKEGESKSFLINYAREVLPQFQVRVLLGYAASEDLTDVADDLWKEISKTTYGVGLIYNFNEDLGNAWFVGATYVNQKVEYMQEQLGGNGPDESGAVSSMIIEAGKRFNIGNLAGMNFSWSPSLTYTTAAYDEEIAGAFDGEDKTTEFKVNLLKLDVLF